jgi:hypothetical protein
VRQVRGPDQEIEVDGVVTVVSEENVRRWLFEDMRVFGGGFEQDRPDLFGVRVIADTDGQVDAHVWIVGCPVGDGIVDEVAVRDDFNDVVVGADPCRTRRDTNDIADSAACFHAVADADGLLDEKDEAGDKVRDNVLETEADADADCSAEDYERIKIYTERLKTNEEAAEDNEVRCEAADGELE